MTSEAELVLVSLLLVCLETAMLGLILPCLVFDIFAITVLRSNCELMSTYELAQQAIPHAGTSMLGGSWEDDNGHGTHAAGIAIGSIHGVARSAIVHPVKVMAMRLWSAYAVKTTRVLVCLCG